MTNPRFFSQAEGAGEKWIRCGLCPHRCLLPPGASGRCRARRNRGGKPELPFYGFVSALAVDPIEKKPLYHFRPGRNILSAGFAGCNLRCPFCQNWHISQNLDVPGRRYSPKELVAAALDAARGESAPAQIAYTYSEPAAHIEFLLDCMGEARKAGAANVLVSNGCVNKEAAAEILDLCDAANIDLKCFSKKTYAEVLGGDLSAVLDFIRLALEKGVCLELTTLVAAGLNDSREELDKCADFIAELGTAGNPVPWHLSACRPAWKWNGPATDGAFLAAEARRAREKLEYVYTGNAAPPDEGFNDTRCSRCGKTLIRRHGFRADASGLVPGTKNERSACFCAFCGGKAPVRF